MQAQKNFANLLLAIAGHSCHSQNLTRPHIKTELLEINSLIRRICSNVAELQHGLSFPPLISIVLSADSLW